MSKRDSRVHIAVRQNDALLEFENFKKKFLLSNKHITKLNSTLSLRIEELNAQISTLCVENLRLRASEIALATQLKREREKCQRIMAEAESATMNLLKHFGGIRHSLNIQHTQPPSPETDSNQQLPRARRPPPKSPNAPRLAQPPTVPDICEDMEPAHISTEELPVTPKKHKTKNTPRTSISRLPLPSTLVSTPKIEVPHYNLVADELVTRKKKPLRRQSGLLDSDHNHLIPPRPASPAFGSPERRQAAIEEEQEEIAILSGEIELELNHDVIEDPVVVPKKVKKEKKLKPKEKDRESERHTMTERDFLRKPKDKDFLEGDKLKDVTNAPHSRNHHPVTDISHNDEPFQRGRSPTPNSSPLSSPDPTPERDRQSSEPYQLPTPQASSSPIPPQENTIRSVTVAEMELLLDQEPSATGNRERRTRKSVNYAEPKLNTKMRKPDVLPPISSRHSMTSAAFIAPPSSRSSSVGIEESRPSRPKTPSSSADSSPVVITYSSSQTRSSTGTESDSSPNSGNGSSHTTNSGTLKRRKLPRPAVVHLESEEGEEDDGAEADAETGEFKGSWVNIDTRRRGGQATTVVGAPSRSKRKNDDDGDWASSRRHSSAV